MKNIDWKFAAALLAAGIAWGSLTFQVRSLQAYLVQMHNRVTNMETYLVHSSNGKFTPSDRDNDQ